MAKASAWPWATGAARRPRWCSHPAIPRADRITVTAAATSGFYVLSGKSLAIVNDKRYPLREGTLLLIERGDRHEIRNTGRSPLRTLNVYVPPAYSQRGDPLPRGRG